MTTARIQAGLDVKIYRAAEGTAKTTIDPTTGAIAPDDAMWPLLGQSKLNDGVSFDFRSERAALMFQGGKGLAGEKRVTLQGFMATVQLYDFTTETLKIVHGYGGTDVAAGSSQVGINVMELDAPLAVPRSAIQIVIGSPYDVGGSEGWMGVIYLPSADLMLGAFNFAIDPEPVELTIEQMAHTTTADVQIVTADAT